MKVAFSYIAVSFEAGEDFWLQVSNNGGTSYTTVATFTQGVEFTNNVRKNATITIAGPFTSTTRFRFRADASADDDVVYIDDVVITGCQGPVAINNGASLISENTLEKMLHSDVFEVKYGPNPALDVYRVQFMAETENSLPLSYAVIDMAGRVVLQDRYMANKGFNQFSIDVKGLPRGTYLFHLSTEKSRFAQKLILSN